MIGSGLCQVAALSLRDQQSVAAGGRLDVVR
jgi:hypothetical protein